MWKNHTWWTWSENYIISLSELIPRWPLLSICLFVHLSSLSVHLSSLSISVFVCLFICLSLSLSCLSASVCLIMSVCRLCLFVSVCLFVYVYLSSLSVFSCLSVDVSLSVHVSVCSSLSVCLIMSLSVHVSLHLSVCLFALNICIVVWNRLERHQQIYYICWFVFSHVCLSFLLFYRQSWCRNYEHTVNTLLYRHVVTTGPFGTWFDLRAT